VAQPYQELQGQLPQEPVLNAEETGWRNSGEKRLIWALVAKKFAFFTVEHMKGAEVLEQCSHEWPCPNQNPYSQNFYVSNCGSYFSLFETGKEIGEKIAKPERKNVLPHSLGKAPARNPISFDDVRHHGQAGIIIINGVAANVPEQVNFVLENEIFKNKEGDNQQ